MILKLKYYIKQLYYLVCKIILLWLPCWNSFLFVIPEDSSLREKFSIKNYTGDNVLFFLQYLLKYHDTVDSSFKKIYVSILNDVTYRDCCELQKQLKYIELVPVISPKMHRCILNYIKYYFAFFKCRIIITPDVMSPLLIKKKFQIDICLNYYAGPFKSDVAKHNEKTRVQTKKYVVASSDFAARMDMCASNVPYFDYKILGFIRHDNIVNPRFDKPTIKKMIGVDEKIKNIILYTPTHRDGKMAKQHQAIIGCDNYTKLNNLLNDNSTVLLVKSHVGMLDDVLNGVDSCPNIIIYQSSSEYTLYDILPHADLLITDYTSTYFDFLVTGKPVIFNFSDREEYEKNRGLSYKPAELFCAGKITYTEEELYAAIEDELSGETHKNDKHYNDVKNLFIKYTDGKTCKRVYDFICKKIAE
ncbi:MULTISPECIES: CDP-glycerol glycerophosphotransferase family protein [unclassified Treponema]|uniref:CDP-glycerol glycerophosphotransferase family protein n=1 Tax=unclassified Treponema TaxID=2638727 RepID=UPI00053010D3|nr:MULTISPECIES: CDP-glycerol glycerophosphotransferase family protein [unclassified Treponema]AIW88914.1 hypothetical protein JO41_03125 [Treponema sp. OMZ 838]UTC51138.1 CDP-glycerol glycerophosphotransferase family protein [Treponema sp. OMZ 855]